MIESHANVEPSDLWKAQLKQRIQQNLDFVLSEAQLSYGHRISNIPLNSSDVRYQATAEYKRDVEQLRSLAIEQYQTEVQRERQERMWSAQLELEDTWSAALKKEQEAILLVIEKEQNLAAVGVKTHRHAEDQWHPSHVKVSEATESQELDTRRARASEGRGTQTWRHCASTSPPIYEEDLRAQRFEKQQEEFRRREEEVRRRVSERKLYDKLNWAESVSSVDSSSPLSTRQSSPVPMSNDETLTLLLSHEDQWTHLFTPPTFVSLMWSDFPWPVLGILPPTDPRELTLSRVSAYVRAPFDLDVTATKDKAAEKERIKEQLRRWHPDRFEVKLLVRVPEGSERERVREGAGAVVRCLSELLGRVNGAS